METRKATMADAPAITDLTSQLGYPADITEIQERLAKILAQPDSALYVAEDDNGAVIGWVQAHALYSLESGFRVEIIGLIVAENARRKGVGRILVGCVEQWTRARGVINLFWRRKNLSPGGGLPFLTTSVNISNYMMMEETKSAMPIS